MIVSLASNYLIGLIPSQFSNFLNLQSLMINYNLLSRKVPFDLTKLAKLSK